jgi:hypothetical protein
LPSISPRHRVHDEEIGAENVDAHELLHHSLGLNRRTRTSGEAGYSLITPIHQVSGWY